MRGARRERFSWGSALAMGACYAALIYFKAELVFLGPIYLAAALLWPGALPRRAALIMCLAGGLSLLPWTYRNWQLYQELIPLRSTGGKLLWWASHHPPIQTERMNTEEQRKEKLRLEVPGKPGLTSKRYSEEGLRRIKADPWPYIVETFTVRARGLFFGSQAEASPALSRSFGELSASREYALLAMKLALFALQGLASILGISGILWGRDPARRRVIPRLHFLGNAAIYLALLGITRYSMVLMPILLPHAAMVLLSGRRGGEVALSSPRSTPGTRPPSP